MSARTYSIVASPGGHWLGGRPCGQFMPAVAAMSPTYDHGLFAGGGMQRPTAAFQHLVMPHAAGVCWWQLGMGRGDLLRPSTLRTK